MKQLTATNRRLYGWANLGRLYLLSMYKGQRTAPLFRDIETYCMFIGYPRSGHSLVGSLLDAHPEMIISHELSALRYIKTGFGREQLYSLILENSQREAKAGRQETGYSYVVPGQWQGKFAKLKVIGDKKGSHDNFILSQRPDLLNRLRATVKVPVKFIHLARNPYDNIAAISVRHEKMLAASIDYYFALCDVVAGVKKQVPTADVFDIRHEAFIDNPKESLKECCRFLGLEAPQDYLDACAGIIFKSASQTRHKVKWTPDSIDKVAEKMKAYPFLEGYSF